VLNWAQFVGIDLKAWPNLAAYYARVTARPHVARAMAEEMGSSRRRRRTTQRHPGRSEAESRDPGAALSAPGSRIGLSAVRDDGKCS
jgi:hypothetical protein